MSCQNQCLKTVSAAVIRYLVHYVCERLQREGGPGYIIVAMEEFGGLALGPISYSCWLLSAHFHKEESFIFVIVSSESTFCFQFATLLKVSVFFCRSCSFGKFCGRADDLYK